MWKYVLQRIGLIILTAFIILSLTYILLQLMPIQAPEGLFTAQKTFWDTQVKLGYYIRVLVGNDTDVHISSGTGQDFYYRPLPIMVRYWNWLRNIFTKFDWGTSTNISVNKPAMSILAGLLPVSMKLNVISMIISIPLGLSLGVWAALKKNTMTDHIISTVIMVFISVPSFVLISFLLILLAYNTGWLPTKWPGSAAQAADPAMAIKAYVIPVAALCFGSICAFGRYTRAELTEVMSSEFLLLARTKGLTKPQTIVRHALRNSMVPIVPMIIGEFVGVLSGSMVLEQIYAIPGIGTLFVDALNGKDYSVVMVDMAIYTLIGLVATLVIDLSYGIVDPRNRMGARK